MSVIRMPRTLAPRSSSSSAASRSVVRRVCPHCSVLGDISAEEHYTFENLLGEKQKQFRYGTGCNFCANTGYLGRVGVFEILLMSDTLRELVVEGGTVTEIRKQAIEEGMVPMLRDGMLKVKEGTTTVSEILRNVFSLE